MTITINQFGGTYEIYKDLQEKGQDYDFYASDTSSGWSWDGKEAHIFDRDKKELGYVYFNQKWFSKSELQIIITKDNKKIEINPKSISTWKDLIWEFEFENSKYVFQEHRGHFRSLFKNNVQVAAFDKNTFHWFDRDVFRIYANKDENIFLLICFAIYSDIGHYNDGATATFNFGNINGSKAPLDGKWRPSKI